MALIIYGPQGIGKQVIFSELLGAGLFGSAYRQVRAARRPAPPLAAAWPHAPSLPAPPQAAAALPPRAPHRRSTK